MQKHLPLMPVIKPCLSKLKSLRHPFHILKPSALPFYTGASLFFLLVPLTFRLHGSCPHIAHPALILMSFLFLLATVMRGFIAIVRESANGYHTKKVQAGLRMGMVLFIVSEVMFFFAFFWAFFHFSLVPSVVIGAIWPPFDTQILSVGGLPLVNTLLLLTSGVTITIAHAYILQSKFRASNGYLLLTVFLGVTFLFCQAYEYKYGVAFSGRGNVYGSIFFITTGFHGLHVTIGTLFLAFCWARQFLALANKTRKFPFRYNFAMTRKYHFGFEAAAGYGHFVDVVGLFLFLTVYGGGGATA